MFDFHGWIQARGSAKRRNRPSLSQPDLSKVERCEVLALVSTLGLPAVPSPHFQAPPQTAPKPFAWMEIRTQEKRAANKTARLIAELQADKAPPPPADQSSSANTDAPEDSTPAEKSSPQKQRVETLEDLFSPLLAEPETVMSGGSYSDPFEDLFTTFAAEDLPETSGASPSLAPLPSIPDSSLPSTSFAAPPSSAPSSIPFASTALSAGSAQALDAFAESTVQLTATMVQNYLDTASAATSSNDAIIAVVDRAGNILGVRVEDGVAPMDDATLVFAIDGAVAKARTAAFFSSNEAPLTSRTIRFISQSTITQREVESNPNIADPNSVLRGPGFVAPIGLGGHFPPDVAHTPPVDLFGIENTNRDKLATAGPDRILGTGDDVSIDQRFNIDANFVSGGQSISAPVSYGVQTGLLSTAVSRGIATLPGGVPLYLNGVLVGGIGVFFPGPDGRATHEQNFVPGIGQSTSARTNAPKVLEAEYIAAVAAFGEGGLIDIRENPAKFRIDLVGVTLEAFGPIAGPDGIQALLDYGDSLGPGTVNGSNRSVQFLNPTNTDPIDGQPVPDGWLVQPHAGGDLSADDVRRIIDQGVAEAIRVRAAIRLPMGNRTKMVFAVTDNVRNVLGLFRMSDATVFSIDVSVAKARNASYYADPNELQPQDQVPGLPRGVAFTARTFRFLAEPRFPSGVDGSQPPVFSILNDPGINPANGENTGAPTPASQFQSVFGFDAFNPGTNFRDPANPQNQNGVVFFPGSTPIYKNGQLVGGLGVSGDGVDQDDLVTFTSAQGYLPPGSVLTADEVFVNGVRLPFFKFPRNPRA